ncbi:hypothetical protein V2J09_010266 [Rumex salicifolius]
MRIGRTARLGCLPSKRLMLFSITVAQKQTQTAKIPISRDPIKELHGRLIRGHNQADPIAISPRFVPKRRPCGSDLHACGRAADLVGGKRRNRFSEVVNLCKAMKEVDVEPDEVTLMKLSDWELADYLVEEHIERTRVQMNVYLGNTLIDMYGKRGLVESAQRVFDQMAVRNLVSWNALIMGYAKLEDVVSARNLFNRMPGRDVVSWTSMITGYTQVGRFQDAVKLFQEMVEAKVEPDEITVSAVLSACSHLGMLNVGMEVHELIRVNGIREDIHVGNALIDMYSKCGVAEKALKVFLEMKHKDSVSWTSVITGLAVNGFADRAVQLFDQMLNDNVTPTHGSFVGILLACAHVGLVDKGLEYFNSMEKVHRLMPQMKHYGCVVDLLSRSGCLERAYEFITSMPVQPDVVLWRILLSACNFHGNLVLAEIVLNKLLQLDHGITGSYLLLSQTYAGSHRWDAATRLRDLMKEDCVHKPSALSSIEAVDSQIYTCQQSVPKHCKKK